MTILYSDVEPLSKFSPVALNLSPATRILNENPDGLLQKIPLVIVDTMAAPVLYIVGQ